MSLRIDAEWTAAPDRRSDTPELLHDEVTLASIRICAAGFCLSRLRDENGEERDFVRVSGYRLARWISKNWWRLGWEAERGGYHDDLAWIDGHSMASIGEGWLWPHITVAADGESAVVRSKRSERDEVEPIAFLSDEEVRIPRTEFLDSAQQFVHRVLDRLESWNVKDSDLHTSWRELSAERSDPEIALYRQLEGSLGFVPDQAAPKVIERLHKDRKLLGVEAMTEVAATQPAGRAPLTAARLRQAARHSGFRSDLGNGALPCDLAASYREPREPAWSYGEQAAREARSAAGLADGLVTNQLLAELCSADSGSLTDDTRFEPMAFSLHDGERGGRVVFRSGWDTGRRFELARLLGDQLLFRAGETLHPATGAQTFRQRVQRAFAAEFLCPHEDLLDFLGEDHSETAQEKAGHHFLISPRAVTTILVNKRRLAREALPASSD